MRLETTSNDLEVTRMTLMVTSAAVDARQQTA